MSKKIGFNVDEEIRNLDKTKKQSDKNREPTLKIQRLGTEWVEFYLESPTH